MTPERYQIVCNIFAEAQEIPREKREAFLREKCGDDEDLRQEIESLLASDDVSGDFIEAPALELAAEILAEEKTNSKIGKQIGQYKILSMLGLGGMGEVWLADDSKLKRQIALKLLTDVQNKDRLARFEQEAFAVSALNHPNIITIFDIGETEGQQFIATEFIEGKTLRQLINERNLTVSQAVDIASQVCAALATAHSAGIIHRDIKPENIMVRNDGIVKVLDFGLARFNEKNSSNSENKYLTKPGMVMGTVNYMSPEQARALPIDEKTDVFSLGIVLYEMLARELPFKGVNEVETLAAILEREPPPLSEQLPEKLRNLINKSLNKNHLERPIASEMLDELKLVKRNLEFDIELRKHHTTNNLNEAQTVEMTALTDQKMLVESTDGVVKTQINPKSSRLALWGVLGLLFFVVFGGLIYFQFFTKTNKPILKEADKFLIAEFENKTGDEEFNGVLRQPLAVSLAQSPFITLIPDGQIRQTLKQMEKKSDEPLTFEIAREIAQRRGIKAFLNGTIETKGVQYLITLETFNTETGESVAKEQIESKNKETIMTSLGEIASRMRERLGESLASIKRLDAPLQESTTNSLEALKSYSLGSTSLNLGNNKEAISHFKAAIELDKNFVAAYVSLGIAYNNDRQIALSEEYIEKAYTLRERATIREKLKIADNYHAFVTGDMEKDIEALELYRQTYPRDVIAPVNLSECFTRLGRFNKAEEYSRMAINIEPNIAVPYLNLGKALNHQSKYDEAKAVFEDALNRKFESPQINKGLFTIAFSKNDEAEMNRQLEILENTEKDSALLLQGNPLIFAGKWREYQKIMNQAIIEGEKVGSDLAADYASQVAVNAAALGKCKESQDYENRALKYERSQAVMQDAALSFALCGENAEQIIAELKQKYPENTVVNKMWLPIADAANVLKDSPEKSIEFLEATRPYEGGTYFWDNYLRGQAYFKLKKNDLAIAEFQKIIQNRGWATQSPLFALAHLQLSKVYQAQNDTENAKKYSDLFGELWKNADQDLPVLKERKTN